MLVSNRGILDGSFGRR